MLRYPDSRLQAERFNSELALFLLVADELDYWIYSWFWGNHRTTRTRRATWLTCLALRLNWRVVRLPRGGGGAQFCVLGDTDEHASLLVDVSLQNWTSYRLRPLGPFGADRVCFPLGLDHNRYFAFSRLLGLRSRECGVVGRVFLTLA